MGLLLLFSLDKVMYSDFMIPQYKLTILELTYRFTNWPNGKFISG